MHPRLHTFSFADPQPRQMTLTPNRGVRWGHVLRLTLGSRWSLSALSAGLIIGLVLVFHAVVTQAVQQSALRQQALAAQSQATWRCKLLPGTAERQACLQAIAPRTHSGS